MRLFSVPGKEIDGKRRCPECFAELKMCLYCYDCDAEEIRQTRFWQRAQTSPKRHGPISQGFAQFSGAMD